LPSEDDIRVAYATCSAFPLGDEDFEPLSYALGGVGCDAVVWDDPGADWSRFDLVVVRATWDYVTKPGAFLSWVHSLGRVANPADVIEWNHDKRYLQSLHVAGVPTVPTRWDPTELPPGRWVAKPTVSAGARDTIAGDAEEAMAQVARIHAMGKRAMVQPYLDGIAERGETALVYLDGQLSHCVGKDARLDVGKHDEAIEPRTPTTDELDLAEQVMDTLPFDRAELLYARVDVVPDRDGDPALLEIELIEPSLFLASTPGAAERLAAAVLGRF
jgi:hypothetical protein